MVLMEEMLWMQREEGGAVGSRGEPGGIMFQVGDQLSPSPHGGGRVGGHKPGVFEAQGSQRIGAEWRREEG